MSSEFPRIPDQEPIINTPESVEDCVRLASLIDEQLDLWASRARTPLMRTRSMADFIVTDCQPPTHPPQDYTVDASFGGTKTHEEAKFLTAFEERQAELWQWARNESLDALETNDSLLNSLFNESESFSRNPYTPENYTNALTIIRRLTALRDRLILLSDASARHPSHSVESACALVNRLRHDLQRN